MSKAQVPKRPPNKLDRAGSPMEKLRIAREVRLSMSPEERKAKMHPVNKWRAKPTLRTAIDGECWGCCGGLWDRWVDGVKALIKECDREDNCTLWPFRPYQRKP